MSCEKHLNDNVIGIDLYNQTMTGGVSKTLNNRATDADHVPCVLILNDQGAQMDITIDKTATLRAQDHGHPLLIFDARGNGGVRYAQQSQEIIKTG